MPNGTAREAQRLADQLERSFRGGAWHGPALDEVLDGIDESTARARPAGSPHSIAELVWHVCFWLRRAREQIEGDAGFSGRDWPDEAPAWPELREELESAESDLLSAISRVEDDRLDDPAGGTDASVRGLLLGILQHNAYHVGQITLLRQSVTP